MRLGVIGAGFIGRAVAALGMKAGYEVMISNSRDPRTLGSTVAALALAAARRGVEVSHGSWRR